MHAVHTEKNAPASDARDCGETDTITIAPGSVSLDVTSPTLCASSSTVSADVTQPLHARQSLSETLTGPSGAPPGVKVCLKPPPAGAAPPAAAAPPPPPLCVFCSATLPSSSSSCAGGLASGGGGASGAPCSDTTHACDGAMKSLRSPILTVPENCAILARFLCGSGKRRARS